MALFKSRRRNGNGQSQKGQQRRRNGRRGPNARTLAPGVGATTNTPFGGIVGSDLRCWDAKLPLHLPLPRAVGPYTVIRATRRITSSNKQMLFGTFQDDDSVTGVVWNNICALGSVNEALGTGATNNTNRYTIDLGGLGSGCSIVPAAMTLQIMNPNALQTTQGILYIGVMNTQAAFGGDTTSFKDRFDTFVEFQNPRLCAAAKLALRGVQLNSYPLNMNKVSEFTGLGVASDQAITWTSSLRPTGWAPFMVLNTAAVSVEYLLTIEYRVRFDLDNVAVASHTHYPVSKDTTWDKLTNAASALGNGVQDIADIVSTVGGAARAMRPYITAASLPMIAA